MVIEEGSGRANYVVQESDVLLLKPLQSRWGLEEREPPPTAGEALLGPEGEWPLSRNLTKVSWGPLHDTTKTNRNYHCSTLPLGLPLAFPGSERHPLHSNLADAQLWATLRDQWVG